MTEMGQAVAEELGWQAWCIAIDVWFLQLGKKAIYGWI